MTTIEEAWAKAEAERLKYGLAMAREDAETVVKHVDLDRSAVRAAMMAAHVDACEVVPPDGVPVFHCGDGWLCDTAKRIEDLK